MLLNGEKRYSKECEQIIFNFHINAEIMSEKISMVRDKEIDYRLTERLLIEFQLLINYSID